MNIYIYIFVEFFLFNCSMSNWTQETLLFWSRMCFFQRVSYRLLLTCKELASVPTFFIVITCYYECTPMSSHLYSSNLFFLQFFRTMGCLDAYVSLKKFWFLLGFRFIAQRRWETLTMFNLQSAWQKQDDRGTLPHSRDERDFIKDHFQVQINLPVHATVS